MKYLIQPLLAGALLLAVASCHHEALIPAQVVGSAVVNGRKIDILSTGAARYRDSDLLHFGFRISDTLLDATTRSFLNLSFRGLPADTGLYIFPYVDNDTIVPIYSIHARQSTAPIGGGGVEGNCDTYTNMQEPVSWLRITSYDSATRQICGTFEAHLYADTYYYRTYDDTLHITNGEFCMTVK